MVTWTTPSPSVRWCSAAMSTVIRRAPASSRTACRRASTVRYWRRARRWCARWSSPERACEAAAAPHRQLRLLHLQPGAGVHGAGRRGQRVPQRRALPGARARARALAPVHLARSRHPLRRRGLHEHDPRLRRPHPGAGRMPRAPVDRGGVRWQGGALRAPHARQDEPRASRWPHRVRRAPAAVRSRALSLPDRSSGDAAGGTRSERHHGRRRDHGRASPRAMRRGRAVSPREHPHSGGAAPARELPAGARRRAPRCCHGGHRMKSARELLQQLCTARHLSEAEAQELLAHLTDGDLPVAMAGALLAALATKGVVADELRGLARAMRARARHPGTPATLRAIDIVGTGGDASGSFNISTGTALLTAACGVPVIKHGNRSVSSRCGSADVLEALGVGIPREPQAAAACLAATGFTFLFAPHYHPATARVAPIRAALGVRTVFNILGPLVNPAQPPLHLIGAYSLEIARLMADTLAGLPLERAFVVHGAGGWDEPTPIGAFTVFDVRPQRVTVGVREPADYGLAQCTPGALAGGDAQHNARALEAVLLGDDRGAHRDCLVLGTALALEVAGVVLAPRDGVARA